MGTRWLEEGKWSFLGGTSLRSLKKYERANRSPGERLSVCRKSLHIRRQGETRNRNAKGESDTRDMKKNLGQRSILTIDGEWIIGGK